MPSALRLIVVRFAVLLALAGAGALTAWPGTAHAAPPSRTTPAPKAAAPSATDATLTAAIRQAINATGLRKAEISVSVRDAQSGRLLVDVDGDALRLPASNMKVLTSGAALHVLRPEFAFRTRLLHRDGRLTVAGDGDPAFGDPELLAQMVFRDAQGNVHTGMTVDDLLDRWVQGVRDAGITRVRELVVDDRVFDRQFTHPQWPADQLTERYCAQVSGLVFHANVLHAFVQQAGDRAAIRTWSPALPWVQVTNRSSTRTGPKAQQTIGIGRTADPAVFVLNGNLKQPSSSPVHVCVHDMPSFFARLLTERLRAAGVQVDEARVVRLDEPPAEGRTIGPVIQTPIQPVLQRCNTDSMNLYAESLLKRIGFARTGEPGSWSNGAAALAQAIDERLGAGTAARGLVVNDGSGLSRGNRVAANLLTAWMHSIAQDDQMRDPFIRSLALAGETGTVARRFKELDTSRISVPCKTGYINGVSTLSGFVGPAGAPPRYVFSVLCNNLTEPNALAKARNLQEKVVQILGQRL